MNYEAQLRRNMIRKLYPTKFVCGLQEISRPELIANSASFAKYLYTKDFKTEDGQFDLEEYLHTAALLENSHEYLLIALEADEEIRTTLFRRGFKYTNICFELTDIIFREIAIDVHQVKNMPEYKETQQYEDDYNDLLITESSLLLDAKAQHIIALDEIQAIGHIDAFRII